VRLKLDENVTVAAHQRSEGSWELRVYVGIDPETGRRVDRSMTIRGNRADAERELTAMVTAVRATQAVGARSTVGELLEAWFAVARAGWAPMTIRQTRSVLDRYLHPHLGETKVGDVTPAMKPPTKPGRFITMRPPTGHDAQIARCGGRSPIRSSTPSAGLGIRQACGSACRCSDAVMLVGDQMRSIRSRALAALAM